MDTYIKKINGKWFAFGGSVSKNQVYSIGDDNIYDYRAVARWNDAGIRYVSSVSPNRPAAYRKARRGGNFKGEME